MLDLAAAERAIADPKYRLNDHTSITPEAARALARGYRHRVSRNSELGEMVTESRLEFHCMMSLDLESVTALAEWGREGGAFLMSIDLSCLQSLSPEVAAALAGWRPALDFEYGGCSFILDGVANASPEALAALAGRNPKCLSATLSLKGLKSLDVTQAKAIRGWSASAVYHQLMLSGVAQLSEDAAVELTRWPGELLGLGIRDLAPQVAAALSRWRGHTLGLNGLWRIAPAIADWIIDMRMSGIKVKLSPQTELAVYANSTCVAKSAEPTEIGLSLGGFDGIFSGKPIRCPFCGAQVGDLEDLNAETWEEQWQHTPCPHVIAVTSNGQSALKIQGVTEQRSTAPGRTRIRAYTYENEMVYEFSHEQFQASK